MTNKMTKIYSHYIKKCIMIIFFIIYELVRWIFCQRELIFVKTSNVYLTEEYHILLYFFYPNRWFYLTDILCNQSNRHHFYMLLLLLLHFKTNKLNDYVTWMKKSVRSQKEITKKSQKSLQAILHHCRSSLF